MFIIICACNGRGVICVCEPQPPLPTGLIEIEDDLGPHTFTRLYLYCVCVHIIIIICVAHADESKKKNNRSIVCLRERVETLMRAWQLKYYCYYCSAHNTCIHILYIITSRYHIRIRNIIRLIRACEATAV